MCMDTVIYTQRESVSRFFQPRIRTPFIFFSGHLFPISSRKKKNKTCSESVTVKYRKPIPVGYNHLSEIQKIPNGLFRCSRSVSSSRPFWTRNNFLRFPHSTFLVNFAKCPQGMFQRVWLHLDLHPGYSEFQIRNLEVFWNLCFPVFSPD